MKRIALFVLGLCAALPAAAQEVTPTAPAEPVPLFQAACVSGAVRLTKKISEPATYDGLPMAARRALGASTTASRGEAEKLPAPEAASIGNTIYRIGGGQLYLLVPNAGSGTRNPISDSCVVLWFGLSDDDYYLARKLVLPNEETVPMLARPTASAVGASVATSARDSMSLTAATYGGWVALRSIAPNPDPKSPGAQ